MAKLKLPFSPTPGPDCLFWITYTCHTRFRASTACLDWKQSTGSLLVGGDSRVIKVWDAQTETHAARVSQPELLMRPLFSILAEIISKTVLELP